MESAVGRAPDLPSIAYLPLALLSLGRGGSDFVERAGVGLRGAAHEGRGSFYNTVHTRSVSPTP